MPSRNQKKRSKQRAEYLQKQDDILSSLKPERATTEKKKASVRDSYKADPEKKASVRDSYKVSLVPRPTSQLRMDYITATLFA